MSALPLPAGQARLLTLAMAGTNRSLLFDKGVDTWAEDWSLGGPAKQGFLAAFCSHFQDSAARKAFEALRARRERALLALGAEALDVTCQTRLVVGLGLPSALETGFLFDRLTGCPYLPGSSVKGLARAAAESIEGGEIGAEQSVSRQDIDRLFGPVAGAESGPGQGAVTFFDAFPIEWPRLEVDVLTPHHREYYEGGVSEPPADWNDPVPVAFLTVAAGTRYRLRVAAVPGRSGEGDLERALSLLRLGLDWLGIGGKRSSGYGLLSGESFVAPRPAPPASGVGVEGRASRPRKAPASGGGAGSSRRRVGGGGGSAEPAASSAARPGGTGSMKGLKAGDLAALAELGRQIEERERAEGDDAREKEKGEG